MPNSPESGYNPEQRANPYSEIWNSIRETPIEQFDSNFLIDVIHNQANLPHKRALGYLEEFALILGHSHDHAKEEVVLNTLESLKKEK